MEQLDGFCNIKDQLDNPAVHKILSYCVFDASPGGIAKDVARYRAHTSWEFFGWVKNGEILGICGFEVHADYVEILHISVAEYTRNSGVGSAMVASLQVQHQMAIEAETDDDAVDFYRKCGFTTTDIQKYGVRRWTCIMPAPDALKVLARSDLQSIEKEDS